MIADEVMAGWGRPVSGSQWITGREARHSGHSQRHYRRHIIPLGLCATTTKLQTTLKPYFRTAIPMRRTRFTLGPAVATIEEMQRLKRWSAQRARALRASQA